MKKKYSLCSIKQFAQLLDLLKKEGHKLLGPTVRNEVITLNEIYSTQDLPIGWAD